MIDRVDAKGDDKSWHEDAWVVKFSAKELIGRKGPN